MMSGATFNKKLFVLPLLLLAFICLVSLVSAQLVVNRVNITQIAITPTQVGQNQSNITVLVTINNTGNTTMNITGMSLFFFNNSGTILGNITSNFSSTLQNTTPFALGGSAASGAGNQTTFSFQTTVNINAQTGVVHINSSVTATNHSAGAPGTENVTDVSFNFGDSFTVQGIAQAAVDRVFGVPAQISQNQTFQVNMSLNNTGEAVLNISIRTSDLRFWIGSTDVTSNYTVNGVSNGTGSLPVTTLGSNNQTFVNFSVTSSITATAGSLIITVNQGFPEANDSNSNQNRSDANGPNVNATTRLQTITQAAIDRVYTPLVNVSQNQTFYVNVTINNTGEAVANISVRTTDLRFWAGATDATANYSVSAVSGPNIINGSNNQSNYTFTVIAISGSQNGSINVTITSGFPEVNDSNNGQNRSDTNGPGLNGTVRIQRMANLSITRIGGSPLILGTGIITIFIDIANNGEAITDVGPGSNVTPGSLEHYMNTTNTLISGLNVTRNDTIYNLTGGSSGTLTFTVTRGTATYDGNVTVNATFMFNDTNMRTTAVMSPVKRANTSTYIMDTTLPALSSGSSLTVDKNTGATDTIQLSFQTTETASCYYSKDVNVGRSAMTIFTTTGATTHTVKIAFDNGVHRVFVRCVDLYGNEALFVTDYFDIVKGGGSGGGGSGGSSSSTAPNVNPSTPGVFTFGQAATTGVQSIAVQTDAQASNVRITVSKLFVPPSSPAIAEGEVYKYVLINKVNLEDSEIKSAKIKFQVEKNWLTDKSISEDTVSLRRLEKEGWKELPTRKVDETDTHVIFEATTPGFSTFAITAGYKELETPQEETTPQTTKTTTPTTSSTPTGKVTQTPKPATTQAPQTTQTAAKTQPTTAQPQPTSESGAGSFWLWGGIIVIILVVAYYVFFSKGKRRY